jgi:hypothetical protein
MTAQIINGNFAGTGSITPQGGGMGMQVDENNPTTLIATPSTGRDTYTGAPLGKGTVTPPPSEPAVVSSQGAQDSADAAAAKLAAMSNKGTAADPTTGNIHYADGSMVPAPPESTYNESTGQYEYNGQKYGAASFYDENQPDGDFAAIQKLFAPLKESLDSDTLGQVNAIEQQYNVLKSAHADINQRADQSRSRSLSLGGATRYAPATASGLNMATANEGLMAIADLDSKENMALAQARSAQSSGDMQLMTKMIDYAEGIRKQKQTQAQSAMDAIAKANADLTTSRKEMDRDEAIANQMANGVTDPAQILKKLNDSGYNMSTKDVADAIKNLTPAKTNATDVYKFTNDDVGKMFAAGMTSPLISQVQDYYNGKGDMPNLTAAQQSIVHTVLSGVTPKAPKPVGPEKPVVSGTLVYTADDQNHDSQILETSRGEDGFVDPTLYQNLYKAWLSKGGVLEDFIKTYPPKNYINPDNEWLPTFLRPKKAAGSGISAADINALFPSK